MAKDHRLDGQPFTCANRRFHTATEAGLPHGLERAGGSVFNAPLAGSTSTLSLWLEHVRERDGGDGEPLYWLMWYDADGNPTIPASGVLKAKDLKEMASRFIEVP